MKILAFGIVKDIFSNAVIDVDCKNDSSVDDLKHMLEKKYPGLNELGSYMIAVNNEYASAGDIINENDEIAVIPPVSGG
ncbi:MoaD/ThiS family protein [Ginsengibacter hankyongi]|uniref:Molybdopterin synthase sulfur carrier subunit n=1 Tax=Ginsengibacter hankyongi TaxID=2607284 RepID=A0A5J5I988_9BACT|nr:MoaD/ThiS family protein [Ginsengibacter hankyongi]KAA9034342.1 MoaD/ThiS family protein [Ginsengibacter hankyongi]